VNVNLSFGSQIVASPVSLTFTTGNWNVAQTITVQAVDDLIVEGAHIDTVTHATTSADGNYNALIVASVTVNITDNDTVGVTELLINGGFETGKAGKPLKAQNWKGTALAKNDRRVCTVASEGACSFRFRFKGVIVNGATPRSLKQVINAPVVGLGDTLTLSAMVRADGLLKQGRILVKGIYPTSIQKFSIVILSGTYAFTPQTAFATLTGTPTRILVMVQPRATKGTFFVDALSLAVNVPVSRSNSIDSLLSLPDSN